MKTSNLAFGPIGRCGCGAIGKRRVAFADEPICDPCVKGRRGFLKLDPDGLIVGGQLTPSQRKARIAWLTTSFAREAALLEESADIHACAVVENTPWRNPFEGRN